MRGMEKKNSRILHV